MSYAVPTFRTEASSEADTLRLAGDLALAVKSGDTIALHGDLGTGKSFLARAVIRAIVCDPEHEVPSPTFTLVQGYDGPAFPIAHFDLYRLADPEELTEIGFDAAIRDGLTLIEWPDRAGDGLPADRLDIVIADGDGLNARSFTFVAGSPAWAERIDRMLAVRRLLADAGHGDAVRRHIQGDASSRSFERASGPQGSAIVMSWPGWRAFMKRADDDRYEDIVHLADDPLALVAIGDSLRRQGLRTAKVLAEDAMRRLLVLEDLGTRGIVEAGRPIAERYLAAARRLADLAACDWPAVATSDDGRHWPMPAYDRRALMTEAALFVDWYAVSRSPRPLPPEAREQWSALWTDLLARFDDDRAVWVLRDYHSPNILWQAEGDPIGLIDFQDALAGPAAYDVASLITDARVDIPDDLAAAMLDAYAARRRDVAGPFDEAGFREAVVILGAQRNAKILGRFTEYAARTGRTGHLQYLPRVLANFEKALHQPVLAAVKLWYERLELRR